MTKTARAVLIAAGGLLLLVSAVLIAAALIPEERVAALAAARAESALGERVRIRSAHVRLLPLPGVRLLGVRVGGDSDSTAVAAIDAAELRARILPLFRGRVVVSRLALERPRVLIEIDSAGRPNLALLARDTAGSAAERSATDRDIVFQIDGVAIDDGRIGYRDLRDGTVLRLDGWTQRLALSGRLSGGRLATARLEGELSFDDIDGRLPDVVLPTRDLQARLEHDATLDLEADRLEIRSLELALNGVRFAGSGTIDSATSAVGRRGRIELAADGLEARELLAWAPDSLRRRLALPDGRTLEVDGTASLRATLQGPITTDSLPDLDGTLDVQEGAVTAGGETLASGIRGAGAFSFDTVVARINGVALGERFQLGVAARNPASPTLVLALSGGADLRRLAATGLIPDTLASDGAVAAELRVQVELAEPADARATGTIEVTGLRLAGLDPAVGVPFATLRFDGGTLRVQPLRLELGSDRAVVDVDLTAEGWIPALVDSTAPPPRVTAALAADTLDLDALLGPAESEYPPLLFARLRDRPVDGRPAAEVAEAAGLTLPTLPPVDAAITVDVGLLVRSTLRYSDLRATLRLRPGGAELENARFGLMGGTVELAGRLDLVDTDTAGTPRAARLAARYALSGVGAAPFFDRLTPFRDHLTGDLDLVGSATMELDRNALPDRGTVAADGTIAIARGRLAGWTVLDSIMGRLGLPGRDTLRFRDWAGSYRLTGPLVTLDETVLRGPDIDARAAGSFDLGGRLDLGATLYLSRDLAERAGSVAGDVVAVAGTDGRVPVGITITGNVESPSVRLDLSEARDAAIQRARQAARDQAREAADRAREELADEVADRLALPDSLRSLSHDSLRAVLGDSLFRLLPDSLTLPGDSTAGRAEAELKARLRRLWPGGGGGSAPDTLPLRRQS